MISKDISHLETDNKEYVDKVREIINEISSFTKSAIKFISKAEEKPLQRYRELLVRLAAQPVKPDNIQELLDVWYRSATWNAYAKSFVR